MTYKPSLPLSQQKCDISSLNCYDHKLTQLLINHPVAVPSTFCIFQEFVEDSDMSDVLLVLLEIDLSSPRSIGLFILTIGPQYNVPSEIIETWDLSNYLPGTIYMTFVLKFLELLKIQCAHVLRFAAVFTLCV